MFRTDGQADTFSRLVQLVTTVLQVGMAALPAPSPASSVFSSKLGETAETLSQEQMVHKQQVKQSVDK